MSQSYTTGMPTISLESEDTVTALYRKITWRIIPLLSICYIAAYLDRINIGFAKLQMQNDLGFSETVYGLGAGLFFIGYMIFEVPSNLILQRMGAKVWIARIMITWGLISACMMFVSTPAQFYTLRFLLGVAEAGFYPGVIFYITLWFPSFKRGKVMALFLLAIPVSNMIGAPLSGWIMTVFDDIQGMSGWQWMFLLEALPSVILGVLILMYLPNDVNDAKWLTDHEKKVVVDILEKDISSQARTSVREAFLSIKIWMLGVIDIFLMMAVYALSFWLPTIIKESGVSSTMHVGMLTGLTSVLAIAALILNGMSSDKHRERRWHLALPAFIAGVSIWASTFFSLNPLVTVMLFSLANIGLMATFPVFWCIPGSFLTGRAAAAGIALIASLSTFGGIGATFMMGLLKDLTNSSETGLIIFAVCLLLAGFLALLFPKNVVNR